MGVSQILEEIVLMGDDAKYQALSIREKALRRRLSRAVDNNNYERVLEIQGQRQALMEKMDAIASRKKNRER